MKEQVFWYTIHYLKNNVSDVDAPVFPVLPVVGDVDAPVSPVLPVDDDVDAPVFPVFLVDGDFDVCCSTVTLITCPSNSHIRTIPGVYCNVYSTPFARALKRKQCKPFSLGTLATSLRMHFIQNDESEK